MLIQSLSASLYVLHVCVFDCVLTHMLIPRGCVYMYVCVGVQGCVCVWVCVSTSFLPHGAVEFLADYSGEAPLCFPAEAGASPVVVLPPSVPPSLLPHHRYRIPHPKLSFVCGYRGRGKSDDRDRDRVGGWMGGGVETDDVQ